MAELSDSYTTIKDQVSLGILCFVSPFSYSQHQKYYQYSFHAIRGSQHMCIELLLAEPRVSSGSLYDRGDVLTGFPTGPC